MSLSLACALLGFPLSFLGLVVLYHMLRYNAMAEGIVYLFFWVLLFCWGAAFGIGLDHGLARLLG